MHPRKSAPLLRKRGLISYNGLLSNYWGTEYLGVRKLAALLTLVFLSIYAAAQFGAASKTLQILLDWPINLGAMVAYVVVLAYCFSGGIRASIWTDSVQFILMLSSISILAYKALGAVGGWSVFIDKLYQNPVTYTQLFPDVLGSWLFIGLFLLGWVAAGLGVVGQPHVAIRFMAMKKHQRIQKNCILLLFLSQCIYYPMSIVCIIGKGVFRRCCRP